MIAQSVIMISQKKRKTHHPRPVQPSSTTPSVVLDDPVHDFIVMAAPQRLIPGRVGTPVQDK